MELGRMCGPVGWRRGLIAALLGLTGGALACTSEHDPTWPEGCQPLADDCFLPFPSDFHREADAGSATGFVVRTAGAAELRNRQGDVSDVTHWRPLDGFSIAQPILFELPAPAGGNGLVHLLDDPGPTLDGTSPTLILRADNGEPVAHFVDVLPRADGSLLMYPLVPYEPTTRYVVVVRNVTDGDGRVIGAPEGYARIRDGRPTAQQAELAQHFEDAVFPVLSAAGIDRGQTQLAWDFTTGSIEQITADMRRVRELTLAWLASNTPAVTITAVEDDPDPEIWRRVHGTVTGPLFLESVDPGSLLARDGDGQIVQNGTITFPFMAQMGTSLRDAAGPGRALEYGHGFFGSREELTYGGARGITQALGVVGFAIDWKGMSKEDVVPLVNELTGDIGNSMDFSDAVHQGMANWLVFGAAIEGPLTTQPELQRANGDLLYDPTARHFIGISQGHILGGVLAALDPGIERICLNVGGAGMTQMMPRSSAFKPFMDIIGAATDEPIDEQKYLAAVQTPLSRIDPAIWARFILDEPLPGTTVDKRVLMQIGVGDASVPNLASFFHARELGLPMVAPSPLPVWGLQEAMAPFDGSALAIYDFGIDPSINTEHETPESNEVHEGVRRLDAALQQMSAFFDPAGTVTQPCTGPCDPQ